MPTAEERLAVIEIQIANLAADVAEHHATVMEQINGGPGLRREDSIRGRLHGLEGDRAAAKVAASALEEAQRERKVAEAARDKAERWKYANLWRAVGALIATAAVVMPYVHGGGG